MGVNIIRLSEAKYQLMSNSLDRNQLRESMNLFAIFTIIVSTTEKKEGNYIV
jgi:hypothetical protein